jgi:hypothetical protein
LLERPYRKLTEGAGTRGRDLADLAPPVWSPCRARAAESRSARSSRALRSRHASRSRAAGSGRAEARSGRGASVLRSRVRASRGCCERGGGGAGGGRCRGWAWKGSGRRRVGALLVAITFYVFLVVWRTFARGKCSEDPAFFTFKPFP